MAKRKTVRPAFRTRAPGAARAPQGTRARTTKRQSKPDTARKAARADRTGARSTKTPGRARGAAARTTASKKAGVKSTTARPDTAGRTQPRTTSRRPRTLARRAQPTRPARDVAKRTGPAGGSRRAQHERDAAGRRRQTERDRRLVEEDVPTPPSSLDLDRRPSAARSGRAEMEEALHQHTSAGPALTGGDVDADWQSAYNTGDEAPGGDMPTPDQDVVEEIGTALGVQYADNEELKGVDKIEQRDRHRWELDPASSEDYQDRARPQKA
jgi:Family of unknown function (DUF6335)